MSIPIQEFTLIIITILPEVLTFTIGLVALETANQPIPIGKPVDAMSLLIEICKLTFVSLAFLVCQYPEALDCTALPLP
jgi:hypothetical protein